MSRRAMRALEGHTIIVHQPNAPSLEGVLIHAHKDCVVLGAAKSLDDGVDLKGEIRAPWVAGVWVQVP